MPPATGAASSRIRRREDELFPPGTDDAGKRARAPADPASRVRAYAGAALGPAQPDPRDAASRLSSITDTTSGSIQLEAHAYWPNGEAKSFTDANAHTTGFAYDGFVRLKTTTYPDSSTESFAYDLNSNLLTKTTRSGGTIQYLYDALNRVLIKTPSGELAVSYGYDETGLPLSIGDSRGAYTFVGACPRAGLWPDPWDPEGRFAQETVDAGTPTSFYYDGLVPVSDYTFALFGSGGQQIHRNVFAAGAPLYLLVSGVRTYAYQDALGSVVALANGSASPAGALAGSYGYDAFGQTPTPTGPVFRYAGQRFDPLTGLVYDNARFYSPALGRFLQPDPIGYAGGNNLYADVENDPVNLTDPSGNRPFCVGAGIGAIAGGSAGYIAGGYTGLAIGTVVGGIVGTVAPQFSGAVGTTVAGLFGGGAVVEGVTTAAVFAGTNAAAGALGTIATNKVLGNPTFEGVGAGAFVGGLIPVLSGEAALVGLGGAAARGLPSLADYVLAVQTGIGTTIGTAAATFTPSAANSAITGFYVGQGALSFGNQTLK